MIEDTPKGHSCLQEVVRPCKKSEEWMGNSLKHNAGKDVKGYLTGCA
jgi:hypothetical protein